MAVGGAQAVPRAAVPRRSPDGVERVDQTVTVVEGKRHERPVAWYCVNGASTPPAIPQKGGAKAKWQGREPFPPPVEDERYGRGQGREEADNPAENDRRRDVQNRGDDPTDQHRQRDSTPERDPDNSDSEHCSHRREHQSRAEP